MNECQTCEKLVVRDNQFDIPMNFQVNGLFSQIIGQLIVDYKTSSSDTTWAFNKNLSTDTIKTFLQRGYIIRESITKNGIVLGNDGLLHFVITLEQTEIPEDSIVSPENNNNNTNQCEWWDLMCNVVTVGGNITTTIDDSIKGTQDAIDKKIAELTAQFNLSIQQAQDAAAAAVAAANQAAADGIAAATKAATEAAAAAAAAAVGGIAAGAKDLQKKLLIGGGIAIAVIGVLIVATRK